MKRQAIRTVLMLVGFFAVVVAVLAMRSVLQAEANAWGGVAGALAVVTAVISAWGAQKVVERQEDQLRPYPYPYVDHSSRYDLVQLCVKNFGGGAAHNIRLRWNNKLLTHRGEPVRFSGEEAPVDIVVLMPGDQVCTLIGTPRNIWPKKDAEDLVHRGVIEFEDRAGIRHQHPFVVGLEQYRTSLVHGAEEPKTLRDLQKIPDELQKLRNEVTALRGVLDRGTEHGAE